MPNTPRPQPQETLRFHFTPRIGSHQELARTNPMARSTTHLPEELGALKAKFPDAYLSDYEYAGEHTVMVEKGAIVEVCRFLKDERGFDKMADLGGIDRFTEGDRFEVMYNVVSIRGRKRLRLKVRVDESDMEVPTITDVYLAANWHERETWDMFGIRFAGHPDLRRMFMPEDFEYHPLRKEFPTLGIPGSLPLPPQSSTSDRLTPDPFAAAHGNHPTD
ncbi:NADH-quinone oxidoreductase subunit C [soil metagenome]